MTNATKQSKIPEFKSYQEEAEFFDSHDVVDFIDELKPVKVKFAQKLSEPVTVKFDPETLDTIRSEASNLGVGTTTLIRMWIMERLRGGQPTTKAV